MKQLYLAATLKMNFYKTALFSVIVHHSIPSAMMPPCFSTVAPLAPACRSRPNPPIRQSPGTMYGPSPCDSPQTCSSLRTTSSEAGGNAGGREKGTRKLFLI